MLEAAIAMPLLIFLACVIIQLALLFNAKLVVNYAAFCAARTALVYGNDEEKMERAAELACVSISYPFTMEFKNIFGVITGDEESAPDLGALKSIPGLGGLVDIADRYVSARMRTEATFFDDGDSKTVTADVVHYSKLIFPIAALGRVVAGSRYQMPRVMGRQVVSLPVNMQEGISRIEHMEDLVREEMGVRISTRCTLRK